MPQNLQRILFFLLLSFYSIFCLHAQPSGSAEPGKDSLSEFIQMKYGLAQELHNGYQYYTRYIKYKGDPFFPENAFFQGSVSIHGEEHDQLSLKYDCFSQFLVMEYTDFQGRYNQMILNSAHIDSFRLGYSCFKKLSLSGEAPMYFQVIGTPQLGIFIHWKKMINSTSGDLQYSHEYSRPLATYYISHRGQMHPFTHRSSLLSVFPDNMAAEIRKYMRKQRHSLKDAARDDWQNLLNYIHQLETAHSEN